MTKFATRSRRLSRVGCALLFLSSFAVGFPAHADTASLPQLLDVQLSETAITVTGLEVHDVIVRLHLTSYKGIIQDGGMDGGSYPAVRLERTSPGRGQVDYAPPGPSFTLASGTAEDGWWEGIVHVTAGYDGTFAVTAVVATQADFVQLNVDPRTLGINAQLQTTGVNIPHLAIRQSSSPVIVGNDLHLFGTVTAADTGVPMAGVTLAIGFEYQCNEGLGGVPATTGTDGTWHEDWPKWGHNEDLSCASITMRGSAIGPGSASIVYVGIYNFGPVFRNTVTARLASPSVRAGGKVLVTGTTSVLGTGNVPVKLQRLAGRRWHTVGTATLRADGHFTLTAQPPSRGHFSYRVLLSPHLVVNEVASTSRTMVLVAR